MLARLSEYQILSERVASLSIHCRHAAAWTTRRENTTYAYFGARTASSRISRKPQAARWDTSTTSATASATTGFNLGTVEYKTISFAVLRRRPVRVAPL